MKMTTTLTWVILIVLALVSAFVSNLENVFVVLIILVLASFKFFGIAFQFMELKKAHLFWKGMIIGFLVVFLTSIYLVF